MPKKTQKQSSSQMETIREDESKMAQRFPSTTSHFRKSKSADDVLLGIEDEREYNDIQPTVEDKTEKEQTPVQTMTSDTNNYKTVVVNLNNLPESRITNAFLEDIGVMNAGYITKSVSLFRVPSTEDRHQSLDSPEQSPIMSP